MTDPILSTQEPLQVALAPFMAGMLRFYHLRGQPGVCDFLAGNPQEMPLPGFVEALRAWSVPQDKDWFAYGFPPLGSREAAAAGLRERTGLEVDADGILPTLGAHGALALVLQTIVEPGDEVLFVSPPWFFYQALILGAGGRPVRVRAQPDTFDLDVNAIARSLTVDTRALIVNTPNNPSGRVYPEATLRALADVLHDAARKHGHPVYVVSDEAYSRIVFDGRRFLSPAMYHPDTFVIYTYSKTTLAPGQRLGYVALPTGMADRERVAWALRLVMFGHGHMQPDSVMVYALPDIEKLSIDIPALQRRRDRVVAALREQGYDVNLPEATFYLLVKSPLADDGRFAERLAEDKVLVLPGQAFEMPGYFRLSLTANDAMVERALPVFAAALEEARASAGAR